MHTFDISKSRYSSDQGVNNLGHSLLELCKNQSLLIINSRAGMDASVGRFTCKGLSIMLLMLFSPINKFYIGKFNECIFDVNSPIFLALLFDTNQQHAEDVMHKSDDKKSIPWGLSRPVWRQEFFFFFGGGS